MARTPDDAPRGTELLHLLREADAPVTLDEMRAAGIPHPAQAVYELQLDGHRISRTAEGLELDEGPRRPPVTPEPPPRVRVRRPEGDVPPG
jgi:Helix-turn-helix domain